MQIIRQLLKDRRHRYIYISCRLSFFIPSMYLGAHLRVDLVKMAFVHNYLAPPGYPYQDEANADDSKHEDRPP